MRTRIPTLRLAVAAAGLVTAVLCMGVVMGDTHVPVAIEPDAARPAGTEVATFALG
jgi:hypothetical protein